MWNFRGGALARGGGLCFILDFFDKSKKPGHCRFPLANLQKGQSLYLRASIEHFELTDFIMYLFR